ncbi:MAG: cytochrome c3 family protein [Planctomycetes bacterium]|nr:cytochrome c3 family protein [Planctomycetota bacterium]
MSLLKINPSLLIAGLLAFGLVQIAEGNWFSDFRSKLKGTFNKKSESKVSKMHKVYHDMEELSCDDCHMDESDTQKIIIPGIKKCMECHEDDDVLRADQIKNGIKHTKLITFKDEVIFSHSSHMAAKLECTECHANVVKGIQKTNLASGQMKVCVGCHEKHDDYKADDCSVCHKEITKSWKPKNHGKNFKHLHGPLSKTCSKETIDDCTTCHSESSCTACHLTEEPRNHNNFFRHRGHALIASMDRNRCFTCHKQDGCDRCHATTEPRSHKGSFGAPRNNHCVSCHMENKEEGCATCHQNTNSHNMATVMPPNTAHTKATEAQCRECHIGPKLPHPDNGESCRGCHR